MYGFACMVNIIFCERERKQEDEIQQLRARIEREHQACVQGLTGLADGTTRHAFINARIERMGQAQEQLKEIIGEEAAGAFLCEVFERSGSPGERGTQGVC